ncbi:MAG: cytochrome P450 [Thermoanaerobaculia bacterium]|nr:cytochrome P450 [Thermoanaerobaculia bacterium]
MDLDIEFLASRTWTDEAAMHERMRWLREHDPVHWSEKDQIWLVTKYADVSAVSKDQELFTSAEGVRPTTPAKIGLIDEGEPRHTNLRHLINKGFTPRMVRRLEATFGEIVKEAIDAVARRGECDFVEAIAVPLPLLLIAEMIGIRREDRERFHEWSDAMIAGDGALDDPEVMARAGQAFLAYSAYVTEIIEDRRKNPRDDLVSILTGAKDEGILTDFGRDDIPGLEEGEQLNLANDELIMLLVILLVAGNETTRNGISGGMQLLIQNPDQRRKLLEDPGLVPSAVEEMLRVVSPVHSFARTATRDTTLRGKPILKGQKVLLLYGSANRDEEVFDDPERFRVERNPHHLAFGIGNHFCLGANLARMEMRIAFAELLRRMPDAEYAEGGPVFRPSALVRSCTRMAIRFTPER